MPGTGWRGWRIASSLAIQDVVPGGFGHRAFDHVARAIQHEPHDNCARFARRAADG